MNYKYWLTIITYMFFFTTANAQLSLESAFPDLSFSSPVFLTNAGDSTDRIFVVEQAGRIKVFQNSSSVQSSKTFLDITDRVTSGGETGLLGLAFHPDYKNNGYFYVDYTTPDPLTTRISRFQVTSNPDSANINSEVILLSFAQPYTNHNGGWIGFGPNDGYLYIGAGDGGSGGDPHNNAQNITKFLGKILRIDVDTNDVDLNYAIPPDNPFVDSTGSVLKEIYAWGMRNPWRSSFDPVTGWLWCGDVGQNTYEEIDIIENGNNYGWNCYEGNHTYPSGDCEYPDYTFPIWEYSHSNGCSITGGYVYRGSDVPDLVGKYIYSDYCSSTLWALTYDGSNPATNETLLTVPASVVSFGVDESRELYIVTQYPNAIYKFTPAEILFAPANFIATAIAPDKVQLTWEDNNETELGFKIERKTDQAGMYALLDSVEQNVTDYSDQSVQENTVYYYRIYAFNDRIISEYSQEDSALTPNTTGVNNSSIPLSYNLEQNYPNPFNPTTKISWQSPVSSLQTLKIYDVLGNEVATLVNEEKPAGTYEVEFNGSRLPSGVYFYKLQAGSFSETKKLLLLK